MIKSGFILQNKATFFAEKCKVWFSISLQNNEKGDETLDKYILDSIMRFYNCSEKTAKEIIDKFDIKNIDLMTSHISRVASVFCKKQEGSMYSQFPYAGYNYAGYMPSPQVYGANNFPRPQSTPAQSNIYEKVNSFDEVKSYHIPSGMQMLFIDANSPYLYTKATDINGKAEIHAFQLNEIPIEEIGQPKVDLSGYVTKEEFSNSVERIIRKIESLEKLTIGTKHIEYEDSEASKSTEKTIKKTNKGAGEQHE